MGPAWVPSAAWAATVVRATLRFRRQFSCGVRTPKNVVDIYGAGLLQLKRLCMGPECPSYLYVSDAAGADASLLLFPGAIGGCCSTTR